MSRAWCGLLTLVVFLSLTFVYMDSVYSSISFLKRMDWSDPIDTNALEDVASTLERTNSPSSRLSASPRVGKTPEQSQSPLEKETELSSETESEAESEAESESESEAESETESPTTMMPTAHPTTMTPTVSRDTKWNMVKANSGDVKFDNIDPGPLKCEGVMEKEDDVWWPRARYDHPTKSWIVQAKPNWVFDRKSKSWKPPGTVDVELEHEVALENFDFRAEVVSMYPSDWGFLCNKLQIVASILHNMHADGLDNYVLALDPYFSHVLYTLDLSYFTENIEGVLLNCIPVDSQECKVHCFTKCESLVLKGSRRIIPLTPEQQYFPVKKYYSDVFAWVSATPSQLRYVPELSYEIVPEPETRCAVMAALRKIRELRKKEDHPRPLFGIHRRFIEGFCHAFMAIEEEAECVNDAYKKDMKSYADYALRVHDPLLKSSAYDYLDSHMNDNAVRYQLEREFPILYPCNYTLTDYQVDHFIKHWPQAFPKSIFKNNKKRVKAIDVVLGTDAQVPQGDAALKSSRYVNQVFSVGEVMNNCFSGNRHRFMLSDMLAFLYSDFFMGNPSSSCDSIVVHWRRALSHSGPMNGTSWPLTCFDDMYLYAKDKYP